MQCEFDKNLRCPVATNMDEAYEQLKYALEHHIPTALYHSAQRGVFCPNGNLLKCQQYKMFVESKKQNVRG